MVNPFLWIVVVGGFVCFLVACGNGANDLANAFGTSYGSRVLTLLQIIVIAAVCEFAGAAGLGSNVATTMSSGIAKMSTFQNDPYVLMYGFLCTLGASFLWLLYATVANLPVSSHHAVAGGIIGFALVYGGGDAVVWAGHKSTFPYVSGVVPIVVSWFVSPLLAGLAAAILHCAGRYLFLERAYAVRLAPFLLPVVVLVVFFLEFLFIFLSAASSRLGWKSSHSTWMAVVVAVGAALLSLPLIPLLRRRLAAMARSAEAHAAEEGCDAIESMRQSMNGARVRHVRTFASAALAAEYRAGQKQQRRAVIAGLDAGGTDKKNNGTQQQRQGDEDAEDDMLQPPLLAPARTGVSHNNNQSDVRNSEADARAARKLCVSREVDGAVVREDTSEADGEDAGSTPDSDNRATALPFGGGARVDPNHNYLVYDEAGVLLFDPRAEYLFRLLQVFTAACTSLAHGSNDVSNSIGPYAAIYEIYRTGTVESTTHVSTWLLCLGGAGIVVGLATFGLNIMRLLGEDLAMLTPLRGCAAEVATALVVSLATVYGIPVSSTHCITGAVLAISMVDVGFHRVRWALVLKMYAGWIFTLVVTAVASACFFAQGITAPVPTTPQ
ncbi:phosphate-repressible phosphate permease [Leptomonas pyrrhocoris]|uniref:Phosphate transporter n=1 Tax=Leptomonas pyrrhocoris TaxID=157538 RepID=A0A0M9FPV3_LEPPY|nr:phosphate-repressible phosphate permease [Leptomonas pyrrhocoris]KPA73630.1 phosphate-repressible phosphate permease [Leptomonas pyrrhocoris]|eukprot:XP_015652069.1 phosphate-repressible phosphate permease [Leptomonas pyrrhocoris]